MPSTQLPAASHIELRAHRFPDQHGKPSSGSFWQTPTTQLSAVHSLKSAQSIAGPGLQTPPTQLSGPVHRLASAHVPVRAGNEQTPNEPQMSSVHGFPSLQPGPGTHLPPEHRSPVVQPLPSSQGSVVGVFAQLAPPHVSLVHALPSLQPIATHMPAQHICDPEQRGVRWHIPVTHAASSHGPATHVADVHVVY